LALQPEFAVDREIEQREFTAVLLHAGARDCV